jgi:spartin
MIAFSTIADGIATSGKSLLTTGGAAATAVVGHKWGDQAGSMAADLAGGVKNVGLVYIDVTGVSRRAVIKSVAKGMVVGKVRGGGEVVVGGGDGGVVSEQDVRDYKEGNAEKDGYGPSGQSFTPQSGEYRPVGFGNQVSA